MAQPDDAPSSPSSDSGPETQSEGQQQQLLLLDRYRGQYPILQEFPSPRSRVEVHEVIGKGNYGHVYRVHLGPERLEAAVKVVFLKEGEVKETLDEVAILRRCRHPNITRLLDTFLQGLDIWICMEYCSAGALDTIYKSLVRPLSELEISYILVETCKGLEYLHTEVPLIHRDLKAGNILLTLDGRVKLADFGVSRLLDSAEGTSSTFIGTPYWMAPEVILTEHTRHAKYTTKCDIWALGITTIEMADKCPPLSDIHPMRALALIPKANMALANPKAWSKPMNDFVAKCLQRNPARRPDAAGCRAHPFLIASNNCLPSLMVAMIRESRNPGQAPVPKAPNMPAKLQPLPDIGADAPLFAPTNAKLRLLAQLPASVQVTCMDQLEQFTLIGTERGLYAVDGGANGPVFPVLQTRVRAMKVLRDLDVVVLLCGKHHQLRQYQASSLLTCCVHFRAAASGAGARTSQEMEAGSRLATALQDYIKLPNTRDTLSMRHCETLDSQFLVLTNRQEVVLMEWAPHPYSKFLRVRSFWLPQVPQGVGCFHDGSGVSELVLYFAEGRATLISIQDGAVSHLTGVESIEQIPLPRQLAPPLAGSEPWGGVGLQRGIRTQRPRYALARFSLALHQGTSYIADMQGMRLHHFEPLSAVEPGEAGPSMPKDWTTGIAWRTRVHQLMLDDFAAVMGLGEEGVEVRAWHDGRLLDVVHSTTGTFGQANLSPGLGLLFTVQQQRKTFLYLLPSVTKCLVAPAGTPVPVVPVLPSGARGSGPLVHAASEARVLGPPNLLSLPPPMPPTLPASQVESRPPPPRMADPMPSHGSSSSDGPPAIEEPVLQQATSRLQALELARRDEVHVDAEAEAGAETLQPPPHTVLRSVWAGSLLPARNPKRPQSVPTRTGDSGVAISVRANTITSTATAATFQTASSEEPSVSSMRTLDPPGQPALLEASVATGTPMSDPRVACGLAVVPPGPAEPPLRLRQGRRGPALGPAATEFLMPPVVPGVPVPRPTPHPCPVPLQYVHPMPVQAARGAWAGPSGPVSPPMEAAGAWAVEEMALPSPQPWGHPSEGPGRMLQQMLEEGRSLQAMTALPVTPPPASGSGWSGYGPHHPPPRPLTGHPPYPMRTAWPPHPGAPMAGLGTAPLAVQPSYTPEEVHALQQVPGVPLSPGTTTAPPTPTHLEDATSSGQRKRFFLAKLPQGKQYQKGIPLAYFLSNNAAVVQGDGEAGEPSPPAEPASGDRSKS